MTFLTRLLSKLRPDRRPAEARDPVKTTAPSALSSLRVRAAAGDAEAQFQLGGFYETGRGVPQNFVDAVKWFKAAAEQGSVPAQDRLGEIYVTGRGAPGSVTASAAAHLEAGGEDSALRRLFPQGLTVRQDFVEALGWNQKAADGGDVGAQVRLAYQFAAGRGAAKNYTQAERWFTAAAAAGAGAGGPALCQLLAGGYSSA